MGTLAPEIEIGGQHSPCKSRMIVIYIIEAREISLQYFQRRQGLTYRRLGTSFLEVSDQCYSMLVGEIESRFRGGYFVGECVSGYE
jgi:hypothetical protein